MIGMPDVGNITALKDTALSNAISFGGAALINTIFGNYWGVFNEFGIPIVLADNVVSLNHKNSSRISHAPVEKGSFASYNKVLDPSNITVQLSKGSGGTLERGAFLTQLEILQKSTLKFYIITPEYVYKNYNITGTDLARSAQDGATLIKVNLTLEEVREVAAEYSNSNANPEDNPTQDKGEAKIS